MAAVEKHNKNTLRLLKVGDLVEFERGAYSHWGVYIGGKEVVHLAAEDNAGSGDAVDGPGLLCKKAWVTREDFWKVAGSRKAYKNNSKDGKLCPGKPEEIRERALSKLGEVGYNVLFRNCEHFATWCRYMKEKSDQVILAALTLASPLVGLGVAIARRVSKEKQMREDLRKLRGYESS